MFCAAVFEDLPFTCSEVFNASGRAENRFVLNARFEVKGKHGVRHGKGFRGLNVIKGAANREVDPITPTASCFKHPWLENGSVGFPRVHSMAGKGDVHANVSIEEEAIDEGNVS